MGVRGNITRAAVVCALVCCSSLAHGQHFFGNDRELEALHERILSDPSNVALSIQYAQLARQRGDYEAAISAYERLLLFNPTLVQLKYELGTL